MPSVAMSEDSVPDVEEFHRCLESLSNHTKEFDEALDKVKAIFTEQACNTKPGISLLELKNHTVLNYLKSLLILMLKKMEGNDIEEVRWDTIVHRTVLERIRSLENKLHYQIDKLLRPSSGPNDALSFKPDVDDLESSENEEESEQNGVYKAPKIAAAHYYEPEPRGKRPKTAEDEAPKLGRGVLEELRKEMSSAPSEMSYSYTEKRDKRARERTEYEESNFIRLTQTKSEKKKARMQSGLNDILDFDDMEMFRSAEAERSGSRGGKKGGAAKGKKSKKFKRKKR